MYSPEQLHAYIAALKAKQDPASISPTYLGEILDKMVDECADAHYYGSSGTADIKELEDLWRSLAKLEQDTALDLENTRSQLGRAEQTLKEGLSATDKKAERGLPAYLRFKSSYLRLSHASDADLGDIVYSHEDRQFFIRSEMMGHWVNPEIFHRTTDNGLVRPRTDMFFIDDSGNVMVWDDEAKVLAPIVDNTILEQINARTQTAPGVFNVSAYWKYGTAPTTLQLVIDKLLDNENLKTTFLNDGQIVTFRNAQGLWTQWQFSAKSVPAKAEDFADMSNWTQVGQIPDSFGGGSVYPERYSNDFYTGLLAALEVAKSQERTTIDCTFFTGEHTFADTVVIDFPVNIIFGSCYVTTHGKNFFTIKSNNVRITGANRQTDRYVTDKNATTLAMLAEYSATNESDTGYHIYSRGNKNCQYRDLVLRGVQTSTGRQCDNPSYPINGCGGMFIEKPDPSITAAGNTCNATVIDNVLIDGTKGAAIYIDTPILAMLRNVRVSSAGGHGIFIKDGTSTVLESCYVASARYAGFCISGLTYGAVINSVAEVCGCGWWIRSCTNVTFFSPGVETTYNYGFNPWSSAYKVTGRFGLGMTTTAADGSPVKINDVPNESWQVGGRTVRACDLFIGYAFVITGGRNVNIFTPYCISIANEVSETNPRLESVSDMLCNMLIMGNDSGCRALTVTNALFQERSASLIPSAISNEIRISKNVHNLDLSFNPDTAILREYTAPGPITSDESLSAPILNLSPTAVIHCGNRFFSRLTLSDVEIRGAADIKGQIVTETGILSKGPIVDFENAELRLTVVWEPNLSTDPTTPTEQPYDYTGQTVRAECSTLLGFDITTEDTVFSLLVDGDSKAVSDGDGILSTVIMSEGDHSIQIEAVYNGKKTLSEVRYLRITPNDALPIRFVSTEAVSWDVSGKSVRLRLSFMGSLPTVTQIGIVYSPSNQAPTTAQNAVYYGGGASAIGTIEDNVTSADGIHTFEIDMTFSSTGLRYFRGYARIANEAYPVYDTTVFKALLSDKTISPLA